ncbi:MAG: hypothetical protein ABSF35_17835 [Polyangia bacterium]|jgi:hypothetical protein
MRLAADAGNLKGVMSLGKHQLAVVIGGVIAVTAIPVSAAPPTAASNHVATRVVSESLHEQSDLPLHRRRSKTLKGGKGRQQRDKQRSTNWER